ncbi:MAG: hypothetical protein AB2693_19470 [Candidatus Thiodiazotropha sp.]
MSTESVNIESTPKIQVSKKRELTSPEFDIEYKKNRLVSGSSISSESDLNNSVVADTADTAMSETSEMASESNPDSTPMVTDVTDVNPSQEATASHIMIPPSEMVKISELLKTTFQGEIVAMVESIVQGVLKGLQDQISSLQKANLELQNENRSLTSRVTALESQVDQAEQYSRRNCLRISGIQETNNENTDEIVLKVASDIGSSVQLPDIDRSHRIGNPNRNRIKPRDIIVKFATYRARADFYKKRTSLKDSGYLRVFVNEDLTRRRSGQLYQARVLMKSGRLKGAWSSDGTILIKTNDDSVHRVTTLTDLIPFGYVAAVRDQPT